LYNIWKKRIIQKCVSPGEKIVGKLGEKKEGKNLHPLPENSKERFNKRKAKRRKQRSSQEKELKQSIQQLQTREQS